jgi:hypothetical protein
MPTRSVLYESGHITVYYRIDASNRLLMGGRGPMQWIRDPSAVAYLMRYAMRLWPALKGVRWTHGWNSRLAMTADHYPHVHESGLGALVQPLPGGERSICSWRCEASSGANRVRGRWTTRDRNPPTLSQRERERTSIQSR